MTTVDSKFDEHVREVVDQFDASVMGPSNRKRLFRKLKDVIDDDTNYTVIPDEEMSDDDGDDESPSPYEIARNPKYWGGETDDSDDDDDGSPF